MSFPVSPFNIVFKVVRREGIEGGLVTGLWVFFSSEAPTSSAVAFACLLRAVEKGSCERLVCSGALLVNVFRPAEFVALVIAPTC